MPRMRWLRSGGLRGRRGEGGKLGTERILAGLQAFDGFENGNGGFIFRPVRCLLGSDKGFYGENFPELSVYFNLDDLTLYLVVAAHSCHFSQEVDPPECGFGVDVAWWGFCNPVWEGWAIRVHSLPHIDVAKGVNNSRDVLGGHWAANVQVCGNQVRTVQNRRDSSDYHILDSGFIEKLEKVERFEQGWHDTFLRRP